MVLESAVTEFRFDGFFAAEMCLDGGNRWKGILVGGRRLESLKE